MIRLISQRAGAATSGVACTKRSDAVTQASSPRRHLLEVGAVGEEAVRRASCGMGVSGHGSTLRACEQGTSGSTRSPGTVCGGEQLRRLDARSTRGGNQSRSNSVPSYGIQGGARLPPVVGRCTARSGRNFGRAGTCTAWLQLDIVEPTRRGSRVRRAWDRCASPDLTASRKPGGVARWRRRPTSSPSDGASPAPPGSYTRHTGPARRRVRLGRMRGPT